MFQSALDSLDNNQQFINDNVRQKSKKKHPNLGRQFSLNNKSSKKTKTRAAFTSPEQDSPEKSNNNQSSKKTSSSSPVTIENIMKQRKNHDIPPRLVLPSETTRASSSSYPKTERIRRKNDGHHLPSISGSKSARAEVSSQIRPTQSSKEKRKQATDWLAKQIQLAHRASILERGQSNLYGLGSSQKSSEFQTNVVGRLVRYVSELEEERQIDRKLLRHKIVKIKRSVSAVVKTVASMRNGAVSLEDTTTSLTSLVETTEDHLSDFISNEKRAMSKLCREEDALNSELEHFDFQKYSEKTPSTSHTSHTPLKYSTTAVDEEEKKYLSQIDLLNKKIFSHQRNEESSSWLDSEQSVFTKTLRNVGVVDSYLIESLLENSTEDNVVSKAFFKSQRTKSFVHKCTSRLPSRSASEIKTHLLWYSTLLVLQDEKKKLVSDWRKSRRGLHQNPESMEEETTVAEEQIVLRKENARQRHEAQKKKEAIEAWHQEKKAKAAAEAEKEKERVATAAAIAASENQRRAEDRQRVSLYQLQKEHEAEAKLQAERLRESQRIKPTKKALEKMSAKAIEQAIEKREKLRKKDEEVVFVKASVNAARDPLRLIRPTSASAKRSISATERQQNEVRRGKESAHGAYVTGKAASGSAHGKSFGHVALQPRSVPSWRKQIG